MCINTSTQSLCDEFKSKTYIDTNTVSYWLIIKRGFKLAG